MTKVLVINGPNLNMLGQREQSIYGKISLEQINNELAAIAKKANISIDFFQSNEEGKLIEAIHNTNKNYDYAIFNPGAFTHTSIALRDAITSVNCKFIEVHLSNIYAREEFRHISLTAPVCIGQISGFGPLSYQLALDYIIKCQNV